MNKQSVALFCLVFLTAVLRFPSLFEPYWHGDEGITLSVGQEVRRGKILYQEISDNKPPLLYLVAGQASSLFQFHLATTVWVIIGVAGFWFLVKQLLTGGGAVPAAGLLVLLASLPLFETNITNGEIWFLPLTIWGMALILLAQSRSTDQDNLGSRLITASGFLFGLASLFKIPAVFDGLGAGIYLLTTGSGPKVFPKFLGFVSGAIVPWIIVFSWLGFQGNLAGFLQRAVFDNFSYSNVWGTDPFFSNSRLLGKIFLLGLATYLVWKDSAMSSPTRLSILWLVFALIGTILPNRPYRHYAIQLLPAFSLAAGLVFQSIITSLAKRKLQLNSALLILFLGTTIFTLSFFGFNSQDGYRQFAYFQRFAHFYQHRGELTYLSSFDPKVPNLYRQAALVKHLTDPSEEIFVWGDNWLVYSLANRSLAVTYPADYLVRDIPGAAAATVKSLTDKPPVLVSLGESQKYQLPTLASIINKRYYLVAQVSHVSIYQKIPKSQ